MFENIKRRRKPKQIREIAEAQPDPDPPRIRDPEEHRELQRFARDGFTIDPHSDGLDVHTVCLGRPTIALLRFLQYTDTESAPMFIRHMEVEDPRFRKRGIGTLMLATAVQYNLQNNPHVRKVQMNPGDIALAGVMEKVFGADNVTWKAPEGHPVAATIGESRAQRRYEIHDLSADIDPDRIMSIHVTAKLSELAQTGRTNLS